MANHQRTDHDQSDYYDHFGTRLARESHRNHGRYVHDNGTFRSMYFLSVKKFTRSAKSHMYTDHGSDSDTDYYDRGRGQDCDCNALADNRLFYL